MTEMINSGLINHNSDGSIGELATEKVHTYYLMTGLFLVTFGIVISIYRFHLVEVSRNEQIKLGFWRIRIAANNSDTGFQTEVRQALTKDAFLFDRTSKRGKDKEIESPLPGHPASDLATTVLNKIVDKIEISFPDKPKGD